MDKLADIQKLRAFAVLMVLFGHTSLPLADFLRHGYTGVSLFFVISGYVVTLSFINHFPATVSIFDRRIALHLRDFFVRRAYRILPVAVGWVFLYLIIGQYINYLGGSYGTLEQWFKEYKWFFSGFYNYDFAESRAPGLFGQYWSLAVEMQFYCVLPFLLVLFRSRKRRIQLCILAILAVSTWVRMHAPADLIGLLTHTQADALFAGVLLCILFHRGKQDPRPKIEDKEFAVPQSMKNIVSTVLLVLLFILPSYLDGVAHPSNKYPIFTALSAIIVYLAQRNEGWILGGSPAVDKVLLFLADRSYSIYVSHVILFTGVFGNLRAHAPDIIPPWHTATDWGLTLQTGYMIASAILLSDLSYRFIELPYLNYGKTLIASWRAKRQAAAAEVKPREPQAKSAETAAVVASASDAPGPVEIEIAGVSLRCGPGMDPNYVSSLVRAIRGVTTTADAALDDSSTAGLRQVSSPAQPKECEA
jgi:peptidoglycan/LPS O-acetylase OafA/YrhL